MQSGPEQLRAWIDRKGLNQTEAAKLLDVHDVVLCQWLSGDKIPGLDNAIMLDDKAGIAVRSWTLNGVSRKRSRRSTARRKPQFASR